MREPRLGLRTVFALGGLAAACSVSLPAWADGNARATLADLQRLQAALERHRGETGALPVDRASFSLAARLYAPEIEQHGDLPVDGWGTPYHYVPVPDDSGAPYRLYSFGANRRDDGGTGDDLVDATQADRDRYPELRVAQRRALGVFPLLVLAAVAPIAWAAIRWSKR